MDRVDNRQFSPLSASEGFRLAYLLNGAGSSTIATLGPRSLGDVLCPAFVAFRVEVRLRIKRFQELTMALGDVLCPAPWFNIVMACC